MCKSEYNSCNTELKQRTYLIQNFGLGRRGARVDRGLDLGDLVLGGLEQRGHGLGRVHRLHLFFVLQQRAGSAQGSALLALGPAVVLVAQGRLGNTLYPKNNGW